MKKIDNKLKLKNMNLQNTIYPNYSDTELEKITLYELTMTICGKKSLVGLEEKNILPEKCLGLLRVAISCLKKT